MATVYGVNKTKSLSPTSDNLLSAGVNGNICFMYDTYEADALAAASVIEVGQTLPAGAVITKITLLTDNLGGSATVDIGDQDDDDRYASALDISGQATTVVFPEVAAAANIANYGYQVVGGTSDQLQITVNTSAVTGTIKIGIEYSI